MLRWCAVRTALPVEQENQRGVILSSRAGVLGGTSVTDTQVFEIVLRQFGC